ncbi:hypothetical protein WJX74_001458 [Apatococcus lobatus]|uniref:Proteasome assembly chaperone 3 n=1 Tax=Apatococcus lobatus TaxID=904363 RepID=A0AAW1RK50_9CHLO
MNTTTLPNGPLAEAGPGSSAQAAASPQDESRQWSEDVAGRSTDFLATPYSDRIMLVASNTGTFGTIMQARMEADVSGTSHPSIRVVLGRREEPGLMLCARRLAEAAAAAGCTRSLLLCIGLLDHSLPAIRTVIQAFLNHPVW